jgi:valyl-tRNA synthetase
MSAPRRTGKPPPDKPDKSDKPAAEKRNVRAAAAAAAPPPDPPAKTAPKSPKARKSGKEISASQDAIAEAQDLAEAVANVGDIEINNKTPSPSPPPVPNKSDRSVTLELNKEKEKRAKLQAETERLKKQLEDLVKEKKRKESDAAEPAPPAKRAVGSGRRSVPQSAAVSRRRLSVCTSISVI